MEIARIRVKEGTGYHIDNSNFYIEDIYGFPSITVAFFEKSVDIWSKQHGYAIDIRQGLGTFTQDMADDIEEALDRLHEGKAKCNTCLEWYPESEIIPYSFAGAVCKKDYDPKKHLPPDTRGD